VSPEEDVKEGKSKKEWTGESSKLSKQKRGGGTHKKIKLQRGGGGWFFTDRKTGTTKLGGGRAIFTVNDFNLTPEETNALGPDLWNGQVGRTPGDQKS